MKMPAREQKWFANLVEDLERKGTIRSEWPNFSKLGEQKYHCHLGYSRVMCWHAEESVLEIEVYYAGSGEEAPY